jgi:hypothetical protein
LNPVRYVYYLYLSLMPWFVISYKIVMDRSLVNPKITQP